MSRPRVRKLSGGPRPGSSRPAAHPAEWWKHVPLDRLAPRKGSNGWAGSLDATVEEARAARRLGYLASLATGTQGATDDVVFAALVSALRSLGINGNVAVLEPDGQVLVVKALALPCAATAEVERVLGEAVVGARIDLAEAAPYRAVAQEGRPARLDAPLWWARLAAHALGAEEAGAIAGLVQLGEVALAPIAAGGEVFGVLTVWASSLTDADLSTAEILGRIAGAALAAQRSAVGAGVGPLEPAGVPTAG